MIFEKKFWRSLSFGEKCFLMFILAVGLCVTIYEHFTEEE